MNAFKKINLDMSYFLEILSPVPWNIKVTYNLFKWEATKIMEKDYSTQDNDKT